jgi:hypothetical protein
MTKRIYIAGAYSGPDVITVLGNMRRGLELSAEIASLGFAVYSPWTDCLLHFQRPIPLEAAYRQGMAWLEVSDAVVLVQQGAEQSHGTQAELARARELELPIFTEVADLCEWHHQTGVYG